MSKIASPLVEAARQWPDTPAIVSPERTVTYSEYADHVARIVSALRLVPGDRVALIAEPSLQTVLAFQAIVHSGAVVVPLNPRLPQDALARFFGELDIRVGLVDASSRALSLPCRIIDLSTFSGEENDYAPLTATHSIDCLATIVLTSGTSARPRAACHTYGNHYYSALGSNENIPFGTGDTWLLSLPLYHVGGIAILFRAMTGGGTVVLPDKATNMRNAIDRYNITHLSLVATQLSRLLDQLERNSAPLASLKAILLGGGPIPRTLIERACDRNIPLHLSYGLTEMASQVTTTAPGDMPDRAETSGHILRYRNLRLSESGEIEVSGQTLFAGYVEGESIARPETSPGWFATGDLGKLDSDSYLSVIGRKDNQFISGGENIQPEEIESALLRLDAVTRAIVVPVTDTEWGERPVAFVEMRESDTFDAGTLSDKLRAVLPGYKIPLKYFSWPEPDTAGSLKISREHLKELAARLMRSTR